MSEEKVNLTENETAISFEKESIDDVMERGDVVPDIDDADLSEMNFAELKATFDSLTRSKEKATMTMEYIKSFREMQKPLEELKETLDGIDSSSEDEETKKEDLNLDQFKNEIDAFEKEYSAMNEKTTKALERLSKEMEERYGNVEKTSSFIVDQMLELITKKEEKISETIQTLEMTMNDEGKPKEDRDEAHRQWFRIQGSRSKMNTMRNALIDREEMNYWKNRYSNPQVAKNIWKDVRKDYHKAMKNAIKYLCRCFKATDVETFRTVLILTKVFPGQQLAVTCFLYDLAKCCRFGKENRTDWYARGLIMNVLDYTQGKFDYHEEDPVWIPNFIHNTLSIYQTIIYSDSKGKYVKEYMKDSKNKEEIASDIEKIKMFEDAVKREKEKESMDETTESVENVTSEE